MVFQPPKTIATQTNRKSDPDYQRAIPLIKAAKCEEALPLFEKALQKPSPHVYTKADYLLCLVWTEAYEKASQYYLRNEKDLSGVSYATRHLARAFYEVIKIQFKKNPTPIIMVQIIPTAPKKNLCP